jgi:hypothetical protein
LAVRARASCNDSRAGDASATLRQSLFDPDGTGDFVNPDRRPHVRNPQLGKLRWDIDSQPVAFGFLLGNRKKDAMLFPDAKLTRLDMLPKEGARVCYTLRVRVFPDEAEGSQLLGVLRLREVKGTLAAVVEPPDGDGTDRG